MRDARRAERASTSGRTTTRCSPPPFAACKDATGKRWVITGWERCGRAWGNPPCPCLHADPVVEDCPPGETRSGPRVALVLRGDRHRRRVEATEGGRVPVAASCQLAGWAGRVFQCPTASRERERPECLPRQHAIAASNAPVAHAPGSPLPSRATFRLGPPRPTSWQLVATKETCSEFPVKHVLSFTLLALLVAPAAADTTGPWDVKALQTARSSPSGARPIGKVREVYYPGEPFQGKPTRVFAYYAQAAPATGRSRPCCWSTAAAARRSASGPSTGPPAATAPWRWTSPGNGPEGPAARRRAGPGRRHQVPRLRRQDRPRHVDLPRRRRRPPRAHPAARRCPRSTRTASPSPGSAGAAT